MNGRGIPPAPHNRPGPVMAGGSTGTPVLAGGGGERRWGREDREGRGKRVPVLAGWEGRESTPVQSTTPPSPSP